MGKYEEFLIGYVLDTQEGNTQNPECTTPEIDLRAAMAKEFHISETWAYELIRRIIKCYPELHLRKINLESKDVSGMLHKWVEAEVVWIELA